MKLLADTYSPILVIGNYLKMGDIIGGDFSMIQHDCDSDDGDVSSGYGFINRHTLYQCEDPSKFKDMDGKVENGDVSNGYGSIRIYTGFQ